MVSRAVLEQPIGYESDRPLVFKIGKLSIDFRKNCIIMGSTILKLTRSDRLLLKYFVHNVGTISTNEEILSNVWGSEYQSDHQILRMAIYRLREKLEIDPVAANSIQTHRGIGYIFAP